MGELQFEARDIGEGLRYFLLYPEPVSGWGMTKEESLSYAERNKCKAIFSDSTLNLTSKD